MFVRCAVTTNGRRAERAPPTAKAYPHDQLLRWLCTSGFLASKTELARPSKGFFGTKAVEAEIRGVRTPLRCSSPRGPLPDAPPTKQNMFRKKKEEPKWKWPKPTLVSPTTSVWPPPPPPPPRRLTPAERFPGVSLSSMDNPPVLRPYDFPPETRLPARQRAVGDSTLQPPSRTRQPSSERSPVNATHPAPTEPVNRHFRSTTSGYSDNSSHYSSTYESHLSPYSEATLDRARAAYFAAQGRPNPATSYYRPQTEYDAYDEYRAAPTYTGLPPGGTTGRRGSSSSSKSGSGGLFPWVKKKKTGNFW